MKKITFLIVILVCSIFGYAQETKTSRIINIKLSSGAEKKSSENLKPYLSNRKLLRLDVKTIKGDIYTIGDILISINADTGTFSKDLLENRKKNSDQFHSDDEPSVNYCSEIRSNNNYKVLLIKYDRSDFSYYSFSGVNNENTKGFAGIMEYKKTDEAKATIDYLLKNLKFK